MTTAHLAPGALVAGKLRVLRLLGMGGMGAVYEVEHELTKHRRALKMLHAQFRAYPAVIARFLREASAAGRIGNPHIIETFDAGELESGEPYLVMEYLDGETLSDLLGKHGKLQVAQLSELMIQACTGVQAAHDCGIVHRDLKPDNLFIVDREGRPFLKLLDFGVSKFDAELTGALGMTKEGATLGTPFYMPPEQVRGERDIDARADVYALGVILYECISGRRPFEADTLPHLALLIHEGKATPLEELRPDLPPGFADIVRRAMALNKGDRFASARELASALAPFARPDAASTTEHAVAAAVPVHAAAQASDAAALDPTLPGDSGFPETKAAKRRGWKIALGAAAVATIGAAALFATRDDGHRAPRAATASLAPAVATAVTTATALTTATAVTAATALTTSTAPAPTTATAAGEPRSAGSAESGASTGAITAATAAHLVAPSASPSEKTARAPAPHGSPPAPAMRAGTRVDQKGLAGDNPFK